MKITKHQKNHNSVNLKFQNHQIGNLNHICPFFTTKMPENQLPSLYTTNLHVNIYQFNLNSSDSGRLRYGKTIIHTFARHKINNPLEIPYVPSNTPS